MGVNWVFAGGPWGPIGNSLGFLPIGFFWGVPLFWDDPRVKFCIFFSKVDPFFLMNRSFRIFVLGFTASSKLAPWIKFNSIEWNFNFYLGFYFYKLFELFQFTFGSLRPIFVKLVFLIF